MEKKKNITNAFAAFSNACKVFSRAVKAVGWACKAVVCTFINFNIWFLDKVFLGPPAIRVYLTGGLFRAGFSEGRTLRRWMRNNAGFDFYNKLYNGVFDNIVGSLLGCAVFPVYTLISHTLKSFGTLLKTNYNYINIRYSGMREHALKSWFYDNGRSKKAVLIGHLFSFYISIPVLILSNLGLGFAKSFWSFLKPMSVMLNYKWCDTRILYEDERPIITKIVSGFFSVPILIPISLVTNVVYGCVMSLWHMLRLSWQFLNRTRAGNKAIWCKDNRNMSARIIFGVITCGVWLPIAAVTNIIYGCYLSMMSMIHAFVPKMKAYREATLIERVKKEFYQDIRHGFSKVLFTMVAAPMTFLIIVGCHVCQSIQLMWRVWGTYTTREAVEAAYQSKIHWQKDWRPLSFKFIGIVLSSWIWMPVCLLSNLWLGCKEGLSKQLQMWFSVTNHPRYRVKAIWNRYDRPRWVKYFFGFITAPLWLPVSLVTNPIIGIATSLYHQARLWVGIVNPLDAECNDHRPRRACIAYAILSAPIWIPMHITIALSVVVTLISTPLVFFFRKSFGTMYSAIMRASKLDNDENLVCYGLPRNNFKSFSKGFLGLITIGTVPAVVKLLKCFELVCSYREVCVDQHILGLRSDYSGIERADQAKPNTEFIEKARIFSDALSMVRTGIFLKGKDWMGHWRIVGRMLGMRSNMEKMIKLFHNAFIVYASGTYRVSLSDSINDFRQSGLFAEARKQALKASHGDSRLVDSVLRELQLSPSSIVSTV